MISISLFLLIFINSSFQYETVTCGRNKTIILNRKNANDSNIIFIESLGFPKSMIENEINNCQFNFLANETDEESAFMFVITNGNIKNIEIIGDYKYKLIGPTYYVYMDGANFTMNLINVSLSSWNAFQGYVVYERKGSCPFIINPFEFKDESQMIYLRSHYMQYKEDTVSVERHAKKLTSFCDWKFMGPKGYGFKLVNKASLNEIIVLATNSSGYDIIKGYGLIENQVYYNNDNYLNVKAGGDGYFEGYVTIIKNKWDTFGKGCILKGNKTTKIWSNIGKSAYPLNSRCNVTIPIPDNSFMIINIISLEAERYIDYIELIDTNDTKHYINHMIPESWSFSEVPAFFRNFNKSENVLMLSFISDGSIQNKGFEMSFHILECTCAPENITLPCEGEHQHSILNQTNQYICPNTVCNFTIKLDPACSTKHIILTFHEELLKQGDSLSFIIYSGNEIYLNSSDFTKLYHKTLSIPFAPNNIISFFATKKTSFETALPLIFILKTIDAPKILKTFKLSYENPSLKLDLLTLPKNSIFTTELSKERETNIIFKNNDILDLFTAQFIYLPCVLLYKDKSMKRIENSLMKMHELRNSIFSNFSVTLYKSIDCKDVKVPLMFRARKAHSQHCVFPKNIFNRVPYNPVITEISKPTGFCEVVLLVHSSFTIKTLWTSSNNNTVTISAGPTTKIENIMQFNKKTIKKNLDLNEHFYTFKIPPSSSLYIVCVFPIKENITFYKLPTKSFFDYPSYEFIKNQSIYETADKPAVVREDSYEIGSDANLYFFDILNKTTRFEMVNQLIMSKEVEYNIIYNDTNDGYIFFHKGINFFQRRNKSKSDLTPDSKFSVSTLLD